MDRKIENHGNVLVSILSEDQLRNLIEDVLRKVLPELKEKESATQLDEFLTSIQVCNLLHVSKSTIVNWRSAGKLKSHKIGNRILFKREQVLARIKELRPFRSVEL